MIKYDKNNTSDSWSSEEFYRSELLSLKLLLILIEIAKRFHNRAKKEMYWMFNSYREKSFKMNRYTGNYFYKISNNFTVKGFINGPILKCLWPSSSYIIQGEIGIVKGSLKNGFEIRSLKNNS